MRVFSKRVTLSKSAFRTGRARIIRAAAVVIAALICALPLVAPAASKTGLDPIAYDKPAPDFTYDTTDGPRKLSSSLGVPVLVHFWDSWCEPCTDELPLLVRAHEKAPHLVIITLSDEDAGVASAYLKKQGIDLPVYADPTHKVFRLYGVHAIPVSVFLRGDGTVEHVSVGEMDWKEIGEALAGLERP